jgi:uncharacterized protein involved in exopolysaccharide biosynthesis
VDQNKVSLKDFWKVIQQRSGYIASVTFGAIMLALVISLIIPPTYEAKTDLRIKQSRGALSSLLVDLPAAPNAIQQMSTYAAIVKSRAVVEKVIEDTQSGNGIGPTYEDMLKRITIEPLKNTEIMQIKVRAASPEEAQLLANTLVDTFKERMTELVRAEQITIREFIGQRLQESARDLDYTEAMLERYKREQKIAAPTEQTKAIIDKLAVADRLSAENAVTMAMAQGMLANAERQLAGQKPGLIADNPLIQQIKGKLAEHEVQLVTALSVYTEKHPKVVALRAGISKTRKMLNKEITRVVNAEAPSLSPIYQKLMESKLQAEAEIAAAGSKQGAIQKIIRDGERDISSFPAKEQGLMKLMRDTTVAQEINVMLAKRYEEARIGEVMQPTDLQVVDVAAVPTKPISPNKQQNALIAGLLGLLAGMGIALYQEYGNRTIRNAQDAKIYLGRPVLASVPDFEIAATEDTEGLWFKLKQIIPVLCLFDKDRNKQLQKKERSFPCLKIDI